jgi:hypothetical protein
MSSPTWPELNILAVDSKISTHFDWELPMNSYLEAIYGKDASQFTSSIKSFQELRESIRAGLLTKEELKTTYIKYLSQLELLNLHFPVADGSMTLLFSWTDIYTEKPVSQDSFSYEKASIIFNIGSVCSQIAQSQNRKDANGVKTACTNLQIAAGIFGHISDKFLHAPTNDMSHDVLVVMSKHMLAQAQECFVEKTIADNKKPTIIAKIGRHAAVMYEELYQELKANVTIKNYLPKQWFVNFELKSKYYEALCHYYKGINAEAESNIGEAIARLGIAEKAIKDCVKLQNQVFPAIPSLKDIESNISQKKVALEKDNNLVYHSPVPTPESLPTLEGLSMVNPVKLSQLLETVKGDMFDKIVPIHVHEKSSLYSEEKAKVVRNLSNQVEIVDQKVTEVLSKLNIEKVLKASKMKYYGPSDKVINYHKEISSAERSSSYQELMSTLDSVSNQTFESVNVLSNQLDIEQRDCESMRNTYKEKWVQLPSPSVSMDIRNDIKNLRITIDKGRASDAKVKALFDAHSADISQLASTELIFKGTYPQQNLLDANYDDKAVEAAEKYLHQIQELQKGRAGILEAARKLMNSDDIDKLLMLNKNAEDVIEVELNKYNVFATQLEENLKSNEINMNSLLNEYNTIKSEMDMNMIQAKAAELNDRYEKAYVAWAEGRANLNNGIQFYLDTNDSISIVQKKVDQFLKKRAMERENLKNAIDRETARNDQDLLKQQLRHYQQPQSPAMNPYNVPPTPVNPYENVKGSNEFFPPRGVTNKYSGSPTLESRLPDYHQSPNIPPQRASFSNPGYATGIPPAYQQGGYPTGGFPQGHPNQNQVPQYNHPNQNQVPQYNPPHQMPHMSSVQMPHVNPNPMPPHMNQMPQYGSQYGNPMPPNGYGYPPHSYVQNAQYPPTQGQQPAPPPRPPKPNLMD